MYVVAMAKHHDVRAYEESKVKTPSILELGNIWM
jgi:hypothetical protein